MANQQSKIKNYQEQRQVMLARGYIEHVETISIAKANIWAFITAGPFAVLAMMIYMIIWRSFSFDVGIKELAIFLLLFLLAIPIHELIHGFTWALCCKNHFKSIRFGFMKEYLTPYCHCMDPLKFERYLLGALMPFFILGIGVFIIALVTQNGMLLLISAVNMLAAGGDTTIAYRLLRYRRSQILDHPSECGFVAFTKGGIHE